MAEYDPNLIYEFADKLYARANSVLATYTALGALLGAGGGFALGMLGSNALSPNWGALIAGVAFGGLGGFAVGREKAFALKLAAQTALCQAQIEENTRPVEEDQ